MSDKNCENCHWFQENLVTEGGMCNKHGIEMRDRHSKILFCVDYRRKDKQLAEEIGIDEIIRIANEEHHEHIGEFNVGCKLCIDGHFVIDEIEAILQKMKQVGCKQSHKK